MILLGVALLLASHTANADTAISLLESFAGNVNFVGTQGTLRTSSNTGNGFSPACMLVSGATSTAGSDPTYADLSGVPSGATIQKAYLYWAGSGSPDYDVTFEGTPVSASASRRYTSTAGGASPFFSAVADVTSIVTAKGNGKYSFENLTVDNNWYAYCNNSTVLGAWALLVIYSEPSETFRVLNLYEGFQYYNDSSITLDVSNFKTPSPLGSATGKHGHITWEGDPDIDGSNKNPENLTFNNIVLSDGLNPAGNQFNSVSNINGDKQSYGVDFDAYTLNSTHLQAGQTSARTVYSTGQDLVFLSAEIVAVPNVPVADLGISMTRNSALVAGKNAAYVINVSNNGPNSEPGPVAVTDTLPAGLSFVSGSGTGWSCAVGTPVTCSYTGGSLASGASLPALTLTVAVASSASGTIVNSASVKGTQFDHISANNTATDSTTIMLAPNHIRIEHDGAGQTCAPETVTVKACANSTCSSLYTGTVTVNLSPSGWSSNPITFSGGSTTASLSITTAQTVTLGTSSVMPAAVNPTLCYNGSSQTCSMTFSACTPAACNSGTISGIINTYYPVTQSLAAGATTITVGSSTGNSTQLASGDLVLVMQMQDAGIDTSNTSTYGAMSSVGAGKYEYATVDWVVGTTVKLTSGLVNSYSYQVGSGSVAQKTIQLVRVPAYSSASLGAGVTASAWNGSTGGVLVFDVAGALNLNGATVDVSGKGFRGGGGRILTGGSGTSADYRTMSTNNANGSKGEGIAGTPRYLNNAGSLLDNGVEGYPNGSYAKGAPANAGGGGTDDNPSSNDENTGGGGGANAGDGGMGGFGWNAPSSVGRGIGGARFSGLRAGQLTLGGGGGAATTNNGTGTPGSGFASSGAAGGGIIMVRAGSLTGNGTFNVSGANGNNTVANDGSGGGGAAGAVLVYTTSGLSGLSVNANGGTGGSNSGGGSAHGPGGGGGGGYVLTSGTLAACSTSGGASGTTYGSAAYGATAGSAGACVTGLISGQIPGAAFGSGACASTVNHYAVSHSGNGITCEAEPVIITAHDASHGRTDAGGRTITLLAKNIAGATGTGSWVASSDSCSMTCYDSTGAPKTCGNSFTNSGSNNGVASYTFANGESGVRLCLRQSGAITQNIDVTDGAATEASTEDANLVFSDTGLRFYADNKVDQLPSLVAGVTSSQTLTIRALKSSETTPARCVSLLGGAPTTKTIKFAYQCVDPNTCQIANGLDVNGTAVMGSGGVPVPASDVSVSFDASGYGSFNLKYRDVGQIKLYAKGTIADPVTGSNVTIATGASNSFVVRPYDFLVAPCTSNIPCPAPSADPNPDPRLSGGGSAFIKSGNSFRATVTARAYGGAATPSFGLGTNNGAESVNLTHTLKAPTSGASGNLSGTLTIPRSSFVNGVVSISDLSWDEVGVITLTATNSIFLGSAMVTTGTSGNIGRFIPDHFNTIVTGKMNCPPALSTTCPVNVYGAVYSGQSFTTQVLAKNTGDQVTTNYGGDFARNVTLFAMDAAGGANQNPPGAAGTLNNNIVAKNVFISGVATVLVPNYVLPAVTPRPGPTNIFLRAQENGGDGVTSLRPVATNSVEGGVTVVNGRIVVSNVYGSEQLALPIPLTVQYWNGTRWVTSTTDTTVFDSNKAPTGNLVPIIAKGPLALTDINVLNPGAVSFSNGKATIALARPQVVGSVDISINASTYLPSVRGRATFGVYKAGPVIYIREIY